MISAHTLGCQGRRCVVGAVKGTLQGPRCAGNHSLAASKSAASESVCVCVIRADHPWRKGQNSAAVTLQDVRAIVLTGSCKI